MTAYTLHPSQTILLMVDIQEKLFPVLDKEMDILRPLSQLVQAFQILNLPIFVSEQYPEGLGRTIAPLQALLGIDYHPWIKSTFSCLDHPPLFECILSLPYNQWIVVGIEAHICVLQTVKGLINIGKQVTVLRDAIASRFMKDSLIAVEEMHDAGARISCVETILFELLKDSNHPQFKRISQLIKT